MAIAYVNRSSAVTGGAVSTISPAYPASVTANNLLVIVVATKYINTCSTPSGWTLIGSISSGTTAAGTDTGSMLVTAFYKIAAGGETGSVAVTLNGSATDASTQATMSQWSTGTSGFVVEYDGGSDNTSGTDWSVTGSATNIAAGEVLFAITSIPTDAPTALTDGTFTGSGLTISTPTVVNAWFGTTGGTDSGMKTIYAPVTAGPGGPVTLAQTFTGTSTNAVGVSLWVRISEAVSFTTHQGAAALTATSTMASAGVIEKVGASSFTATSSFVVSGTKTDEAASTLTATSSLISGAVVDRIASSTFSSTSTFTSAGEVSKPGEAALTATSTLAASADKTAVATASFTSTSTLAAAGTSTLLAASALAATSTFAGDSIRVAVAASTLTSTSTFTSAGTTTALATVGLSNSSVLVAASSGGGDASSSLTSTSTLVAAGTSTLLAASALTATATLSVAGLIVQYGAIAFVSTSTFSSSATTNTFALQAFSSSSTLVAAGTNSAATTAMSSTSTLNAKLDINPVSFVANLSTNWSKTSGTTLAVSSGATSVTAGNTLLIAFAMDPAAGGVSAAMTSGTGVFTPVEVQANASTGSDTSGVRVCILTTRCTTTGTFSLTITHPTVIARAVTIYEFKGADFTQPVTSVGTPTASTVGDPTSELVVNTTSGLIFAAYGIEGIIEPQSITDSAGSPLLTRANKSITSGGLADENILVIGAHKVAPTVGVHTLTATNSTSGLSVMPAVFVQPMVQVVEIQSVFSNTSTLNTESGNQLHQAQVSMTATSSLNVSATRAKFSEAALQSTSVFVVGLTTFIESALAATSTFAATAIRPLDGAAELTATSTFTPPAYDVFMTAVSTLNLSATAVFSVAVTATTSVSTLDTPYVAIQRDIAAALVATSTFAATGLRLAEGVVEFANTSTFAAAALFPIEAAAELTSSSIFGTDIVARVQAGAELLSESSLAVSNIAIGYMASSALSASSELSDLIFVSRYLESVFNAASVLAVTEVLINEALVAFVAESVLAIISSQTNLAGAAFIALSVLMSATRGHAMVRSPISGLMVEATVKVRYSGVDPWMTASVKVRHTGSDQTWIALN